MFLLPEKHSFSKTSDTSFSNLCASPAIFFVCASERCATERVCSGFLCVDSTYVFLHSVKIWSVFGRVFVLFRKKTQI